MLITGRLYRGTFIKLICSASPFERCAALTGSKRVCGGAGASTFEQGAAFRNDENVCRLYFEREGSTLP